MKLLAEFRIFVDHYQFFVHDSDADPCPESFYSEPDEQCSDFSSDDQGFITNGKTICFITCAHFNNHWLQVYLSEQTPDFESAERVIALPLQIESGIVAISDFMLLEPDCTVSVSSGQYGVYLLAFNLGVDEAWEYKHGITSSLGGEPLSDEQLRARLDFERYKIVLVPGMPEKVGVVFGSELLHSKD